MSVKNFYVEGVMGESNSFSHLSRRYEDGCSIVVYQRDRGMKVPVLFVEGSYDRHTDSLTLHVINDQGDRILTNTTQKGSGGMVSIRKCVCSSSYQDEHYGRGMRVFNRGSKTWICTVCGAQQPADTISKKELADAKK